MYGLGLWYQVAVYLPEIRHYSIVVKSRYPGVIG